MKVVKFCSIHHPTFETPGNLKEQPGWYKSNAIFPVTSAESQITASPLVSAAPLYAGLITMVNIFY